MGKLVEALRNRPEGRGFDFGIEIFHCHNPSGGTVAPRSTQSLIEMSIKYFMGGKGGWRVGLTTLPP